MNHNKVISPLKKAVAFLLLFSFTAGAFATLGDGLSRKSKAKNILSEKRVAVTHGSFSLKSGYNYRGSNVINLQKEETYIDLNTVATYQKGNRTYILPVKSKVLVKNIKVSAGVPQLNR